MYCMHFDVESRSVFSKYTHSLIFQNIHQIYTPHFIEIVSYQQNNRGHKRLTCVIKQTRYLIYLIANMNKMYVIVRSFINFIFSYPTKRTYCLYNNDLFDYFKLRYNNWKIVIIIIIYIFKFYSEFLLISLFS